MMTTQEMKAKTPVCWLGAVGYFPVDPRPDGDDLREYRRIMLRHHVGTEPELVVIDDPNINYGWVIGLAARDAASEATKKPSLPYPMCYDPKGCAGKTYCTKNPTCID